MAKKVLFISVSEKTCIGLQDKYEDNIMKFYCRLFVDMHLGDGLNNSMQLLDTIDSRKYIEENELMNRCSIGMAYFVGLLQAEYRINIWKPIEFSSSGKKINELKDYTTEVEVTDSYYEWLVNEFKKIDNRKKEFEDSKNVLVKILNETNPRYLDYHRYEISRVIDFISECIDAGYAPSYDNEKISIARDSIMKMSHRKDSSHPNYVTMLNIAKNALWRVSFPKSFIEELSSRSIKDDLDKIK